MKTNFHNKNFVLSLALTMRFKATRKWPIICIIFENFAMCVRYSTVTVNGSYMYVLVEIIAVCMCNLIQNGVKD